MKYRIVKRAKGWCVQSNDLLGAWYTISTHRLHFIAALRLLWLRERARK